MAKVGQRLRKIGTQLWAFRYQIIVLTAGPAKLVDEYIRHGWAGTCYFTGLFLFFFAGIRFCRWLAERAQGVMA